MKKIFIIGLILLCSQIYALIPLRDSDIDGIIYIREESKLTKDFNLSLFDFWELELFNSISSSEQVYMDELKLFMDKYEIEDPIKEDTRGVFTKKYFSNLYQDLKDKSESTRGEALILSATIEEMKINDLDELIAGTENREIIKIYKNLRYGSISNMRLLLKDLEEEGLRYKAKFLTSEVLKSILLN